MYNDTDQTINQGDAGLPVPGAMSGGAFDLDRNPFIVIWEATRACHLACHHCRAVAQPHSHPLELNTGESRALIDQVAEAAPTVFVITGGDPMLRPDLIPLIQYATDRGLRLAFSPSATPRLLKANFKALMDAGVRRMSLSIDGPDQDSHDSFRGVKGTWCRTIEAVGRSRWSGMSFQINTTITRSNIGRFEEFASLMDDLQPALWSVFVLVPTGRADHSEMPDAQQLEAFFLRLAEHAVTCGYPVKTTEGQHFRRVMLQAGVRTRSAVPGISHAPMGVNDGKGFVFISHTGMICPSGFLPLEAGSTRCHNLLEVYRDHTLFKSLRDPTQLKGKCGLCEFKSICGGSRARAYAVTGDYLAEEPLCSHQPLRMRENPL